MNGTHCGQCNWRGRTTPMLTRFPGAAPICPLCDRIKCGKCGAVQIEGTEQKCRCGDDVTIATALRRSRQQRDGG